MPWQVLSKETEIIAIHAALLPTSPEGDILIFGDWNAPAHIPQNQYTHARLYRIATEIINGFQDSDLPNTNAFCCGQAFLADGRLLAGGGTFGWPPKHGGLHGQHYDGERACWLYLPRDEKWVRVKDLNFQPGSDSIGGGRWYPTLVTLGNGEVFAAAGHPSDSDNYPLNVPSESKRHNNSTPERYSPRTNSWTLMTADITAPNGLAYETDGYPRFHLLPCGMLFSDTAGKDDPPSAPFKKRLFDPYVGVWTGNDVDDDVLPSSPDYYSRGSAATSVLLPLLPPNYRARILATNSPHDTAFRIDLDSSPKWVVTSPRQNSMKRKDRENGCAVLLPTGQVLLSGGWPRSLDGNLNNATLMPELYTPGINWGTGEFSETEKWEDLAASEAASVGRGYHSVALLLPDGRVWTAGSTTTLVKSETLIEIYSPSYVGQARPTIQSAPSSVGYGQIFQVETGSGNQIQRVAVMRCGSVTHGFDSDQRYVGLMFTQDGNTLTATSPPDGNVAPPGYYMLWVIDTAGRPCQVAKFIRISDQQCSIRTDRSTFSRQEVKSTGLTDFTNALYVYFDNFIPLELSEPPPMPRFTFDSPTGTEVPGMSAMIAPNGVLYEDRSKSPDVAQRITIIYDIRFNNDSAFEEVPDLGRDVNVRVTVGQHTCDATINLIKKPNPYMEDGRVHWLSTDLRVFQIKDNTSFKIKEGEVITLGPIAEDTDEEARKAAEMFINKLVKRFNDPDLVRDRDNHPFEKELPFDPNNPEASQVPVALFTRDKNNTRVFNFAMARVHSRSAAEAADVKVFFRLFNTLGTALEYDKNKAYKRFPDTGTSAIPVLGLQDGELVSIPFFGDNRADTTKVMMEGNQTDELNKRTFPPAGGDEGPEVFRYFGCWLDINQPDTRRFPLKPPGDRPNGPYNRPGDKPLSIFQHMRGDHHCLVAEIFFDDDPTHDKATPGSSDNLTQRNLAIQRCANPGDPRSRVISHTFEVKTPGGATVGVPSELIIRWNDLPRDTRVTLYLPDMEIDDVLSFVAKRGGAHVLEKVDAHSIGILIGDITYIPIPGERDTNIPGLLILELPEGIAKGQVFTVTVHQSIGQRIIGAFQITIPVSTATDILPDEARRLSVMRYIAQAIQPGNRWYSIFGRYLDQIADRVRGLGGDPDSIAPSPDGSGMADKGVTILFRSPQYYLLHLKNLPGGTVLIGGVNLNAPVGTTNIKAIKLALKGGKTPLQRLNEEFVAAQLSLNAAGGSGSPVAFNALWTKLHNYSLNVAPVRLSNDYNVTPNSMLGNLFEQARLAIAERRDQDMLALATLLDLLNGNDPL